MTAGEFVRQRTVYDGGGAETLPGRVVRNEGQGASADVAVNEAYDGLGATFDFYRDILDRNSIDDEGLHLDATVHYGQQYDNAFWNGQQMVFGDGDGDLFNRFTIALDVIGHELTHGVTGDEAGLVYVGQPGALNESISDVFGTLVKQYARHEDVAKADWLIGAGLFTARVHGVALRSMKAPGTAFDDPVLGHDEQPATHDALRAHFRRQRRRASSTPASRIARSTLPPRISAASRGRPPGASGTRRCATSACARPPRSRSSHG